MAKTPQEPVDEKVVPPPQEKQKKALRFSPNLASFIVVVAALGYLIYGSWQAFQAPVVSAPPQISATPGVPELKLNQENKRQAPPITVDEGDIGKQNPFQ